MFDSADTTISESSQSESPEDVEKAELEQKILLSTNNAALDEQLEKRPLAKKQEELEGTISHETNHDITQETSSEKQPSTTEKPAENQNAISIHQPEKPKQALLKNDDRELSRIEKVCPPPVGHQLMDD